MTDPSPTERKSRVFKGFLPFSLDGDASDEKTWRRSTGRRLERMH
jgi:hypothetical protein